MDIRRAVPGVCVSPEHAKASWLDVSFLEGASSFLYVPERGTSLSKSLKDRG